MLTAQQITLVQHSFAKVAPIAETAATLFYKRLFEIDPNLRGYFKGDLKEQERKLMTMLALAVNSLTRLDQLVPAVQSLGRRHEGYGVTPRHYETVAVALLWTLEQGLGADFTNEVKEAWIQVYTLLANTMQTA